MCGILGILASNPSACSPEAVQNLAVWRDRMARRGPDGAGLASVHGAGAWSGGSATFAHRRLAVIEPGLAGAQPMTSACGRWMIAYNGELYNDAEVRAEIGARWAFRTRSDTETVMAAVAVWGLEAASRLRGMYALALLDARTGTAWLARDPLGIKPIFIAERGEALFFSSEPRPAAEWAAGGLPGARVHADPAGVAAYMTTIRTTLGARTMYPGVRTLLPGEWLQLSLAGGRITSRSVIARPRDVARHVGDTAGDQSLRGLIERSVKAHLRSDVPLCCLLSGGLDSTIIATLAQRHHGDLHTYCAGAVGGERGEDFIWAERVARRLGTRHTEVGVTRRQFSARVPEMIEALGAPLSTPNEVAIHEVAKAMRADGKVVTLSGEGADELFGGYDQVLAAAATFEAMCGVGFDCPKDRARHSATFWLASHAWVGEPAMARILRPDAAEAAGDRTRACIESAFAAIEEEIGALRPGSVEFAVERHLRYQRRVNLEGLLRRLDTAAMLAGVEGRTPLADAVVCDAAERLPAGRKIRLAERDGVFSHGQPADSKIALRDAFAGIVPEGVLTRPKASFPLPFDAWMADLAPRIRDASLLREFIRPEVLEVVAAAPAEHWRLAWPLANLAIWSDTLAAKPSSFVEPAAEAGAAVATALGADAA